MKKEVLDIVNIYSTKSVNIITLIISLVIFSCANFFTDNYFKRNMDKQNNTEEVNRFENSIVEIEEDVKEEKHNNENMNWYIEIPSINLKAPIEESINMDVLNTNIGHFEDTPKESGNIGLAGHNRGYEKNYFENLKNVKKGDEIRYKYNDFEKTYTIEKIEIIKSTNWSYLENTLDNRITLITCVENKPDDRLCLQGVEK